MPEESLLAQQRLAERVMQLEELFTHLQQTLHDLNAVVLEQMRRVDRIESGMAQMKSLYGELAASPPVERDPDAERPPHY